MNPIDLLTCLNNKEVQEKLSSLFEASVNRAIQEQLKVFNTKIDDLAVKTASLQGLINSKDREITDLRAKNDSLREK